MTGRPRGVRALAFRGGAVVALCALVACASAPKKLPATPKRAAGFAAKKEAPELDRCKVVAGREASEYDTSGDGRTDVRKVYVAINAGLDSRTVMICRQTDVNGDGTMDVVRYYDDDGRSLREESDRDFDGKFDRTLVFQEGHIFVEELDENHDGKVDTKIFFDKGQPSRAERDLSGRSTPEQWRPDRWEYYENGHVVRTGTDLDGDSRVDRWDRDVGVSHAEVATGDASAGASERTQRHEQASVGDASSSAAAPAAHAAQ